MYDGHLFPSIVVVKYWSSFTWPQEGVVEQPYLLFRSYPVSVMSNRALHMTSAKSGGALTNELLCNKPPCHILNGEITQKYACGVSQCKNAAVCLCTGSLICCFVVWFNARMQSCLYMLCDTMLHTVLFILHGLLHSNSLSWFYRHHGRL